MKINQNTAIIALVSVVAVVTAISMFVNTLDFGNRVAGLHQRLESRGLVEDPNEWPKPFQAIYNGIPFDKSADVSMSVCYAAERDGVPRRVAMCKIKGWQKFWRKIESQLKLKSVSTFTNWHIQSSSVRGDLMWWDNQGKRFANEDFLQNNPGDHFQVSRTEDVMFIHYTYDVPLQAK